VINFWGSLIEEYSGVQVRKAQVLSFAKTCNCSSQNFFKTKRYKIESSTQCSIIPPDDLLSDSVTKLSNVTRYVSWNGK